MHAEKGPVKYKLFLFIIPALTFFLIYTHQIFWSPIHGDGAVYSHLIKEFSETGGLHWRTTIQDGPGESGTFFDHPYFFFVYSYPFIKVFGSSDFAVKIPNILVGLFAVYLIFLLAGRGIAGILAGYFLALNPTFELQTRQPMLDPLAQVLAFCSVALIYLRKNFFLSGVLLGLAFLTKGLELLPNLAATFLFILLFTHEERKLNPSTSYARSIAHALIGFCIPLGTWFAWDFVFNQGHWTQGYYYRQFASRFFNTNNAAKPLTLDFVKELINIFEPHLFLLTIGSLWMWRTKKTFSLLWKYNLIYIFMTCLAFTLIKKVALQHYTGIFLSTSVVLGLMSSEFINDLNDSWKKRVIQTGKIFSVIILTGILGATAYYWTTPFNKKDLWGNVLAAREQMKQSPQTPVLIDPNVSDYYGLFYAAQWYWPNPIYSLTEKDFVKAKISSEKDHEVFVIHGLNPQEFSIEKQSLE